MYGQLNDGLSVRISLIRSFVNFDRSQKHLKFQGRLQLWRFLKDAGLTCDEQINLFRSMWTDASAFDKE